MSRVENISKIASALNGILITSPFEQQGEVIQGSVSASVNGIQLPFQVVIKAAYPLQFHGSETISFFNKELIDYDHVMKNGNICIHTSHSPDLKKKLQLDFDSLNEWISKFYVNKATETHYEHIVVPHLSADHFFFTEVERKFKKNDYGIFSYSKLADSKIYGSPSNTFLVQQFDQGDKTTQNQWSSSYRELGKEKGIFVFVEDPPVVNRKFAVENWNQLAPYLNQEFLGYLYKFLKQSGKKTIPLLMGYNIYGGEAHWQIIFAKGNEPPVYGEKIQGTKNYLGKVKDKGIVWGETKNCSPQYFFGRGMFAPDITNSNILIIGVGAVGSMVATSLARGGCKKLTIADHDIKGPENVCRSQYDFKTGITTKVIELSTILTSISPFVEVTPIEQLMDAAKIFLGNKEFSDRLAEALNSFDIIFDCSTDDDVAYVLEQYKVRAQVFNLSITNQAKELVCATSPGLYGWLKDMNHKFRNIESDSYNPTGCWNPTFKASHNDVAVLVQFALRQINSTFLKGLPTRNFILTTTDDDGFGIKLQQF